MRRLAILLALAMTLPAVAHAKPKRRAARRPAATVAPAPDTDAPAEPTAPDDTAAHDDKPADAAPTPPPSARYRSRCVIEPPRRIFACAGTQIRSASNES